MSLVVSFGVKTGSNLLEVECFSNETCNFFDVLRLQKFDNKSSVQ